MFGGGGGFNPRKMEQMMEQMGIDMEELDAEEVVITTPDGQLVFDAPDVTKMDARGQSTFQIVGEPEERAGGGDTGTETAGTDDDAGIPEDDVETVAMRTGVSQDAARDALEKHDGDLAAAVAELE
jgi:nascent polypeptide-associated complex subunit alpha